uniref:CSON001400 protein n=1 Tax=Culicoides sonorensis TaxID=179676 RepID=A0A336MU47_CULSO
MADNKMLLELCKMIAHQSEQNSQALHMMAETVKNIQAPSTPQENTIDILARGIDVFDPENLHVFKMWYDKHKDVFEVDGGNLTDDAKSRLLLRKITQKAYEKFSNIILPKKPSDLTFEETISKLEEIFCESESTFQLRFKCFNVEKSSAEDFLSYGARVNKLCENAKISTIKTDEFKTLIFMSGLKSTVDFDVKTRLLSLVEDESSSWRCDTKDDVLLRKVATHIRWA